jgi:uncharacterized protein
MKRYKKEIRVIGIDDSPFNKFKDKNVLVVGSIYRGSVSLDGVISTKVRVDGIDSTEKIAEMINRSKFKSQLKCIFLDGIAVAGFNVIDVPMLHRLTEIPVIVVMTKSPDFDDIKVALNKAGCPEKIRLMEKAGEIFSIEDIFVQLSGISVEDAKNILKICTYSASIPEALRASHMIGAGIIKGESRGL